MKHVIYNVIIWFTWRMINKEHFLMQKHKKNVEARAMKVVTGVKYLL